MVTSSHVSGEKPASCVLVRAHRSLAGTITFNQKPWDGALRPFAELAREPIREALHELVAVAPRPTLLDLDELPPDEPMGVDHRRVDRTRDLTAHSLQDLCDALVELILLIVTPVSPPRAP